MEVDFSKSHRAMDAKQHKDAYSSFTTLLLSGSVVVFVALIGMALFLT